jgi:hypothetical protein
LPNLAQLRLDAQACWPRESLSCIPAFLILHQYAPSNGSLLKAIRKAGNQQGRLLLNLANILREAQRVIGS